MFKIVPLSSLSAEQRQKLEDEMKKSSAAIVDKAPLEKFAETVRQGIRYVTDYSDVTTNGIKQVFL